MHIGIRPRPSIVVLATLILLSFRTVKGHTCRVPLILLFLFFGFCAAHSL